MGRCVGWGPHGKDFRSHRGPCKQWQLLVVRKQATSSTRQHPALLLSYARPRLPQHSRLAARMLRLLTPAAL